MKLLRLAAGACWTVYAVFFSNHEDCPLLDFIQGLEERVGDRVLSDLRQYVPLYRLAKAAGRIEIVDFSD
jgi:hypothetical protein